MFIYQPLFLVQYIYIKRYSDFSISNNCTDCRMLSKVLHAGIFFQLFEVPGSWLTKCLCFLCCIINFPLKITISSYKMKIWSNGCVCNRRCFIKAQSPFEGGTRFKTWSFGKTSYRKNPTQINSFCSYFVLPKCTYTMCCILLISILDILHGKQISKLFYLHLLH